MHVSKFLRVILVAGALAGSSAAMSATSVFAYGAADHPLAQLTYAENCNNPAFCGVALGGVWIWIEIDGGPTSGTADIEGAGCRHILGLGGGASHISGELGWFWSPTPVGFDATLGTFSDPNGDGWYVVIDPNFGAASFPVAQGHYSAHPAPGVNFDLQVAP